MMDFDEFAKFLAGSDKRVRPELEADAVKIGEIQKRIAVDMIGRENPKWPPLAESTVEEKTHLGYVGHVSATDPLLRVGTLRDSIEIEIEPTPLGVEIVLGSHDRIAVYQELGTSTIPARPFLATATLESMAPAAKILGQTAVDLLVPKGP
jgi:hypothetical protein